MPSMRRTAAMCSIPLSAAAAVGTGTAIALSTSGTDSGVNGRVVPCGIVLESAAPCVTSKPGTVVVGRQREVVRRVKVRADGSFRARLDAGRYWLQPRSGATQGPRARATVDEGEWTTVTLVAGRLAPPAGARP